MKRLMTRGHGALTPKPLQFSRQSPPRFPPKSLSSCSSPSPSHLKQSSRCFTCTSCVQRARLSSVWIPTGGIAESAEVSGYEKLVRVGFLRQARQGVFHMLPLGLRVQDKIEKLLDKHMESIGACRLSLSSITSAGLWKESGRFEKVAPEMFQVTGRKDADLMLAPTHEEEITAIMASGALQSYKDLPLRLYQITRKYRDELRPRHGLLRSREFLMKDLYSFDLTYESALETYEQVSAAYKAFFSDLGLPITAAEASSGEMGGDLSHEYHLASPFGPDTVLSCNSCGYAANDEVAKSRPSFGVELGSDALSNVRVWRGVSKDRKTLVNAFIYGADKHTKPEDVNIHQVKSLVPDLDTSISDDLLPIWENLVREARGETLPHVVNVVDSRLAPLADALPKSEDLVPQKLVSDLEHTTITHAEDGSQLNLVRLRDGDGCPRCTSGSLHTSRTLELAHTFYLGTRYTQPLGSKVNPPEASAKPVHPQMGCYGIGVSRVLGSVVEHMVDDKGLNWPRAIAPFEVVVIASSGKNDPVPDEALEFYDEFVDGGNSSVRLDAVLDDRKQRFPWKMKDADAIGYPVIVILPKGFKEKGTCEVQCRRLSVKDQQVPLSDVRKYVMDLLARL